MSDRTLYELEFEAYSLLCGGNASTEDPPVSAYADRIIAMADAIKCARLRAAAHRRIVVQEPTP